MIFSRPSGRLFYTAKQNKANLADHQLKTYTYLKQLGLSGAATMEQVCEAMPLNSEFIFGNNTLSGVDHISDVPCSFSLVQIRVGHTKGHTLCNVNNTAGQGAWIAYYHPLFTPKFTGWVSIATATLPKEYDLPLEAGFFPVEGADMANYWKNQFGECGVNLTVMTTNVIPSNGLTVARLPVGFRPTGGNVYASAIVGLAVSGLHPAWIVAHQTGEIKLRGLKASGSNDFITWIGVNLSFVASL